MRLTNIFLFSLVVLLVGAGSTKADFFNTDELLNLLNNMVGRWHKPDFCGQSECPPFKCRDKTDDYEVRRYDRGLWALTNVTDTKYELAYTKAATRLMRYFKGANEDKASMELTVPTLTALKLNKDASSTEKDYSFSLWLSPEFQKKDEAPEPSSEDVEIIDFPEVEVFVRSFGGFATENTILDEVKKFHEVLDKDEKYYDKDCVFVAVYDPAVKLFNRHNEIHIYKEKEEKVDAARKMVSSS